MSACRCPRPTLTWDLTLPTREEHEAAFPVHPVSYPRGAVRPVYAQPPHKARKPDRPAGMPTQEITLRRLDLLRGRGPLTVPEVEAIWLAGGVPAPCSGGGPALAWYLRAGLITRPRKGHRGQRAAWEVAQ